MPRKSIAGQTIQAAIGEQMVGQLDSCSVASSLLNTNALLLGSITVAGDYFFDFPVAGMAAVEIHVRASASTGTITPIAFLTFADGTTSKLALTDSGAGTLAAGVRRTFSSSALKGEKVARLKITVDAAATVTLDQCEMNGL